MSNPIQKHFVILCNQLDVEKILPYLRAERMVTSEEYETLSYPMIPLKQKREKLLIMMPRKGSDFFKNFGNCLVWSGQIALAKHIGVDVAAVPMPCPHDKPSDPFQALSALISPGSGSLPPGMSAPLPTPTYSALVRGDTSFVRNYPSHHDNEYLTALRSQQMGGGGAGLMGPRAHYIPHTRTPLTQPSAPTAPRVTPAYSTVAQHTNPTPYQPTNPVIRPVPSPFYVRKDETDGCPPKVFILYHKDSLLQQTHQISTEDFIGKVTDMAHILHSVGGFELTADLFEKNDIDNWSKWTEQKIQESRYVVLLLSPGFSEALNNPERKKKLETERGSFFINPIINLIGSSAEKFIPVFLSNCEDYGWIPNDLRAAPKYTLDIDMLVDHITVDFEDPAYYQKVQDAIQMQHFVEIWGRLINHLRGQSHQVPPAPANPPIQVPFVSGHSSQLAQATPTNFSPDRYISDEDFLRIAQTVADNWQTLGRKLGLHFSELESLASVYYTNHIEAAMAMLGMWQRVKGDEATRRNLKTALSTLGYGRIAMALFAAD